MREFMIPYVFALHTNVMSGQCRNSLIRIQVRYTAFFLFPMLFPGWVGSQAGLFVPSKSRGDNYRCIGFEFSPWLAPDIAVNRLPKWYKKTMRLLSFRINLD